MFWKVHLINTAILAFICLVIYLTPGFFSPGKASFSMNKCPYFIFETHINKSGERPVATPVISWRCIIGEECKPIYINGIRVNIGYMGDIYLDGEYMGRAVMINDTSCE